MLAFQLIGEWHYENHLNSLRTLFKKNTSRYVYICVDGDSSLFPYLDFLKLFMLNMYLFYHTNVLTTRNVPKTVNIFFHHFMNSFYFFLRGTGLMSKTKLLFLVQYYYLIV